MTSCCLRKETWTLCSSLYLAEEYGSWPSHLALSQTVYFHQLAQTLRPRWSTHTVNSSIFILKKLSFSILNLISLDCVFYVCSTKGKTNFHFAVQPSVVQGQMNFLALEGNLYLFPTCLPVCVSFCRLCGWSCNHSLTVVPHPSEGERAD